MPDVRRRDLGDAMGQAVAGIAGGLASGGSTAITQIRDITSTGRDRDLSGASVVGTNFKQSFAISSPGSDGFTITLPGATTSAWEGKLTVRSNLDSGVTMYASLAGVLAVPAIGFGDNPVSSGDFATFSGGDEIVCEAILGGSPGGPFSVTVDFVARPL